VGRPAVTEGIYVTETDIAGANELLSQEFDRAILNREGTCVRAGFTVTEAANGKVRVYHRSPVSDYSADVYPTSDELDEERKSMTARYMTAFIAAGWYVRQRNSQSRHTDLLASRQPW